MQIRGEEFIKKVQIQQEREELERKLNELEEVQMSFNSNEPVNFEKNNNYNNYNNLNMNENENELDNIMLGSSISNEDNKKKYLILGIVLVVLFLLTIIIIRLLTNEPPKEDQFTTNNLNSSPLNSSPTKKDSDNIEENFQKIMNERVKKDSNEPMVPEVKTTTSNTKTKESNNTLPPASEESTSSQDFDNLQKEAQSYTPNKSGISDEAMDQTIKKIEKSKNLPKDKPVVTPKEITSQKEEVVKNVDTKKSSIRDLMDSAPYSPPANSAKVTTSNSSNSATTSSISNSASGYFIQIGAFTKKPTDSYLNTIKSASLKYKIYEDNSKGTLFNKVLIGPYSSKEAAAQNVENVKEKLNVTSAFVVKF